jgi:hypothetical protein
MKYSDRLQYCTLLMEMCYHIQFDRLGKEFIVPLEKHINSEQEEKQVAVRVMVKTEKQEIQEIVVGQKRCARTEDQTASTRSASQEQIVADGGTRRSKRVKVAPTHYVQAEEESLEACFVISNTALTAAPRPLDHSSATEETTLTISNEDTNTGSSRRVSAVAAASLVHRRRKFCKTFDERFKDLMSFKEEFGHCNVPSTKSRNNKHSSLGVWCSDMRQSYKTIKKGGMPRRKLSEADIQRLEKAGFEWNLCKTVPFDERFKDLMAFKAEFYHCNVHTTNSSNKKHSSLGLWCKNIRRSYKAIKEGMPINNKLTKADIKRLEKAGFEWRLK